MFQYVLETGETGYIPETKYLIDSTKQLESIILAKFKELKVRNIKVCVIDFNEPGSVIFDFYFEKKRLVCGAY